MQTIYLDISNKGVSPVIYAKQGEIGRRFSAYITDSGVPYTVPVDSLISVWYSGKGGDGNYTHIGENSAFSIDGNVVTVELIAQMLQNDGPGTLCLVINSSDGSQIGLWNILYFVEGIPGSGSDEAKKYYTAFSKDIEKLYEMFGGEAGGGGGGSASDIIFVTTDHITGNCSMTSIEIMEAIQSGKIVVYTNEQENRLVHISTRYSDSNGFSYAYFVNHFPQINDDGVTKMVANAVVIDSEGAAFTSGYFELVPLAPYSETKTILAANETGEMEWVDTSEIVNDVLSALPTWTGGSY